MKELFLMVYAKLDYVDEYMLVYVRGDITMAKVLYDLKKKFSWQYELPNKAVLLKT